MSLSESVVGRQILGDDQFIERVEKSVETVNKPLRRPSLKEIISAVTKVTGVKGEEMKSRSRNSDIIFAKKALTGACREAGYRLVDLQSEVKRDLSVLSRWSKVSESKKGRIVVQKVFEQLYARLQV